MMAVFSLRLFEVTQTKEAIIIKALVQTSLRPNLKRSVLMRDFQALSFTLFRFVRLIDRILVLSAHFGQLRSPIASTRRLG